MLVEGTAKVVATGGGTDSRRRRGSVIAACRLLTVRAHFMDGPVRAPDGKEHAMSADRYDAAGKSARDDDYEVDLEDDADVDDDGELEDDDDMDDVDDDDEDEDADDEEE